MVPNNRRNKRSLKGPDLESPYDTFTSELHHTPKGGKLLRLLKILMHVCYQAHSLPNPQQPTKITQVKTHHIANTHNSYTKKVILTNLITS